MRRTEWMQSVPFFLCHLVAFVGPFFPAHSGVAVYNSRVLDALDAPDLDVELFAEKTHKLMDLALKLQPDLDVFYIDTGYFFPETETLIERLQNHYQRALRRASTMVTIAEQSSLYGEKLYRSDPDLCCHLRKVAPMETALRDSTAWITALRRDQSDGRKQTPVVQWNDRYSVVKIAPLVNWTEEEIWDYVHQHKLPYNTLHDQHYPSIGCWPCTRAVRPGEDIRAGRWAGRDKSECGIHGSGTPAVLTLGSGV